jgi:hypothetical protein
MAVRKDTGHGATITFGTSSLAYSWTKMGAAETDRGEVETTTLATTDYKTFMPGDLADPGEFEVEYLFDTETAQNCIAGLAAETITVTFPVPSGGSVAARCTGTGFVKKRTLIPELSTDTIQVGKLTVRWDGETGPNFVVGS